MWILPNNLKTSSAFVADTLESSEDYNLPGLNLEHSLMWRSKPSPLQTWSRRWNRVPWIRALSGRILKPSQHISFETELTSSRAAILASLSQPQESAPERMIPGTSGPGSDNTSIQFDLFDASSKTSKDTSRLDSEKSSKIWKALITQRRGEFSARLKSARRISANESTSLQTPAYQMGLTQKPTHSVPTPTASDHIIRKSTNQGASNGELNYSTNKSVSLDRFVAMWPTPTTQDNNQVKGKDKRGTTLGGAVRNWPTPAAHEARLGYQDRSDPTKKGTQKSLTTVVIDQAGGRAQTNGQLNPDWVEWLMDVPTGWTDLGSWATA